MSPTKQGSETACMAQTDVTNILLETSCAARCTYHTTRSRSPQPVVVDRELVLPRSIVVVVNVCSKQTGRQVGRQRHRKHSTTRKRRWKQCDRTKKHKYMHYYPLARPRKSRILLVFIIHEICLPSVHPSIMHPLVISLRQLGTARTPCTKPICPSFFLT